MSAARQLEVVEVVEETADSVSLVFGVPEEEDAAWGYRPGQFLTLRIPSDRTGHVARCYSLASSPLTDQGLKVTVKRTADGYGSNWLCDNARAGTRIDVLPPSGRFTPASLDQDLLLFAGGSGITPVLSILKSVLVGGDGRVSLFYANRDERSVIFAGELAELAEEYADRLEVVHWLESVQGLLRRGQVAAFARARSGRSSFVCGPAPFMSLVQESLVSAGLARADVHLEVFSSLSGDPFAEQSQTEVTVSDSTAVTTPVEVEMDGQSLELDWPADVTLVDLLLAKGIDVPYMCRDGECGTCQATLQCGTVQMEIHAALDPADVADGYILTCQARPDGGERIRVVF